MLYNSNQRGAFKISGFHDPDSSRIMGILLRPDTWAAGTVYEWRDADNYDVVMPTTYKGFYHKVSNPGKSNATTEPTWAKQPGDTTNDFEAGETDGLIWEAVPYNLMPPGETISTATYVATNGVTVSATSNTDTACQFKIDAIGTSAAARTTGNFQVTTHITKSNGEILDVTLEFKVHER
jgi:hypothetical protein